MHMLAISLLAILAGTLLLAKFRKENQGKFFAFVSWFFIAVGFLLFLGFIAGGIWKVQNHGFPCKHECRQEIMMKKCGPGMKGAPGCPGGMNNEMCVPGRCAMPHDSMMKCCPKRMMKCDSTHMTAPK